MVWGKHAAADPPCSDSHSALSIDPARLMGAVTACLSETTEPVEVVRCVLRQVCSVTGWAMGRAYRVDSAGQLTRVALGWRSGSEVTVRTDGDDARDSAVEEPGFVAVGRRSQTGGAGVSASSLVQRAIATASPMWATRHTTDDGRTAMPAQGALRSVCALPVVVDAAVVAVLEFVDTDEHIPDAALVDVVDVIGAQLRRVFERDMVLQQAQGDAAQAKRLVDTAGDAYIAADGAGIIVDWNQQAERLFGWSRGDAIGRPFMDLVIPETERPAFLAMLRQQFAGSGVRIIRGHIEAQALRQSGLVFPIEMTVWSLKSGGQWHFYSLSRDVTRRRERDEDLAQQASHDPLTGLPNRTSVVEHIDRALARQARSGRDMAVLFLDLDGLKVVNDSFGHDAGDELLKATAERLSAAVRPSDLVARLSGDEFVVVCDDLPGPTEATRIAERIHEALRNPVGLAGGQIPSSASIGIVFADSTQSTAQGLLRDSDVAMYRAKERGGGCTEIFDDVMREDLRDRWRSEQDLAEAIEKQELRLHYQPIIDLASHEVVGMEALVRWQHPERGLLPPSEFLAIAERTGMIVSIGSWVLTQAVQQTHRWRDSGFRDLTVTVNLSGAELTQADFAERAAAIFTAEGLDPSRVQLDFEVTDTLLFAEGGASARMLGRLRSLGVGLAIDDFDAGCASMSHLKRLPVNMVKIDRTLIAGLDTDPGQVAVVRALVDLGHSLGLTVLAEGVETETQHQQLISVGCDLAQGYYFAAPSPAEAVALELLGRRA